METQEAKLTLAGRGHVSTLYRVENGFVNLVAVVGFLIVAIGLIPTILLLGSPRKNAEPGPTKRD
ncbi:MAG: hypothetical protein RL033_6564 [Pseudomonadota bacterium]|jgi:hypothetical protein